MQTVQRFAEYRVLETYAMKFSVLKLAVEIFVMQRSWALLTSEAKCSGVHKKSRFTSRAKSKKTLEAQARRAIQVMTHDWLVNSVSHICIKLAFPFNFLLSQRCLLLNKLSWFKKVPKGDSIWLISFFRTPRWAVLDLNEDQTDLLFKEKGFFIIYILSLPSLLYLRTISQMPITHCIKSCSFLLLFVVFVIVVVVV